MNVLKQTGHNSNIRAVSALFLCYKRGSLAEEEKQLGYNITQIIKTCHIDGLFLLGGSSRAATDNYFLLILG